MLKIEIKKNIYKNNQIKSRKMQLKLWPNITKTKSIKEINLWKKRIKH